MITQFTRFVKSFVFSALVLFSFSQCQKESFTRSGMADDYFVLQGHDGMKMPVKVAGNVSSKKFLVIVHGGPGGSAIVYREPYVRNTVEKQVAIVYWEQRFAGHAQGNIGSSNIADFRRDMKDLMILLRNKYGDDNQYYLFAHSWGGFLAPYFLIEGVNQELVNGWIQIGGAHNYRMNDSLTREMLLHYGRQELAAGRNTEDWDEIVDWCENNGFSKRSEAVRLNGFAHQAENLMPVDAPSIDLFNMVFRNNIVVSASFINLINSGLRRIDSETYDTPNSNNLHKISIPTLLLWGKYDFVCPPELADDIEANISSPILDKIIFERSGHSPMMNQEPYFWRRVIEWVKDN